MTNPTNPPNPRADESVRRPPRKAATQAGPPTATAPSDSQCVAPAGPTSQARPAGTHGSGECCDSATGQPAREAPARAETRVPGATVPRDPRDELPTPTQFLGDRQIKGDSNRAAQARANAREARESASQSPSHDPNAPLTGDPVPPRVPAPDASHPKGG